MSKYLKLSSLAALMLSLGISGSLLGQGENEHHHEDHATHEEHEDQSQLSQHAEGMEEAAGEDEAYDPTPVVMHHIKDSHGFHVVGDVSVSLPVILWTNNGLVTFMSSAFHHDVEGHHIVERNGMSFVNVHEDIYQLNEGEHAVQFDEEHHPTNASKPLDFSITKNVFTLLLAGFIVCLIFMTVARKYKSGHSVPKGLAGFMEPLVVFVRDDIAKPNIGKKYDRYMPLLLTMFFLIWILNLLGLVPFFPGSANMSGNIAFTMSLAVVTLLVTNFSGNSGYWKHILLPPVPKALWPIMIPVEIIGILTKPFALMIRLFANITAGHIIVLSLISLIFIFKTPAMGLVSVPFALFISVLELLVAALQAYIFTMLTALFIGTAVAEDHH